eukprot:14148765-Alexandrium_andersonii.AAC.1
MGIDQAYHYVLTTWKAHQVEAFPQKFSVLKDRADGNDDATWAPILGFVREAAVSHFGPPSTPFCEHLLEDISREVVDAVRDAMFPQPVRKAPRRNEGGAGAAAIQPPANAATRVQKLMSPKAHKPAVNKKTKRSHDTGDRPLCKGKDGRHRASEG